ncbi:hypothetical protein KO561_01290 [Radiobacillus kanasensis]|uniref:hypothetical protein n=1 Tax=Radiobacillus kanasensis TaxID=2844358 RepID=UPI001E4B7BA8|nr:hypothetical protein [Radiobacillus kanasensis]UFT99639.1 hypothetical protein KO561_01290 [Radiobacillus kanasensis]
MATYQPPFLDIQVQGKEYTVFGDIGEAGYYAPQLIKNKEETSFHLVFWNDINLGEDVELRVDYPSEKSTVIEGVTLAQEAKDLVKEHGIQFIYQVDSFVFEEEGMVDVTVVENGKDVQTIPIEVH